MLRFEKAGTVKYTFLYIPQATIHTVRDDLEKPELDNQFASITQLIDRLRLENSRTLSTQQKVSSLDVPRFGYRPATLSVWLSRWR